MIWKIVFTVIVIAAVWFGYRLLARMGGNPVGRIGSNSGDADENSEDMEQCTICNSFVPRVGARSCGRDECPHLG